MDLPHEADDIQVDNAPVRRHQHQDLTIEGYSRAAVQTYWRVVELKIGFDLGLQPWSFMTTPTWTVSHAHMDHIAALPVYVARRRLMRMAPPTIYLPASAVNDVKTLLGAYQRLDRGRLPCNLVPCRADEEFDLSREHVLSSFATNHTIPSLGYTVWDRRKKLKQEYLGLEGHEIRDLRLSGVDVTHEVRLPLVTFIGDSNPSVLDTNPDCYRSRILILEMTFVAAGHRREKIHKFGHMHLDDIVERADRFENELIIASHFSTRYHEQQIRRMVERRLPASLRGRLLLWI
ncbi:MBL fold metallo-hydrolase [Kolteria novifilia]|uniref:MBL fold metallo-hydrolase n=1 Tax=Kolteria novifilia TaxID=2527975 RepID=UPI003AF3B41C